MGYIVCSLQVSICNFAEFCSSSIGHAFHWGGTNKGLPVQVVLWKVFIKVWNISTLTVCSDTLWAMGTSSVTFSSLIYWANLAKFYLKYLWFINVKCGQFWLLQLAINWARYLFSAMHSCIIWEWDVSNLIYCFISKNAAVIKHYWGFFSLSDKVAVMIRALLCLKMMDSRNGKEHKQWVITGRKHLSTLFAVTASMPEGYRWIICDR